MPGGFLLAIHGSIVEVGTCVLCACVDMCVRVCVHV